MSDQKKECGCVSNDLLLKLLEQNNQLIQQNNQLIQINNEQNAQINVHCHIGSLENLAGMQ